MMINIEQIQKDIEELPEEAQGLLVDFIDVLKKRYSHKEQPQHQDNIELNPPSSPLEILENSDLIGCISAEPDLSIHYKSVLQKELDSKYDNR